MDEIETRLQNLGVWLEKRLPGRNSEGNSSLFVRGFLAASVLYCTGPMAVLGAISLLATQLNTMVSSAMMNEMTATGGILLMGIGISSMLELKKSAWAISSRRWPSRQLSYVS